MNIYIDVEILSRELDSKLLLAILAASKGHKVLVSRLAEIILGFKSGTLAPGIFHTTSLAPSAQKILRHQNMINNGSVVTSMDEEGGLIDHGYDKFAKIRYSDQTLEQSSAVFGWGSEDAETLKKIYSKQSSKIYNTGSPRADMWKSNFHKYWGAPKNAPKRPYLLVSSNMFSVSSMLPFYKNIQHLKQLGYFQRDPKLFSNQFKFVAEDVFYDGDNGTGGSIVEAALDDFSISYFENNTLLGDSNSDGILNILDVINLINLILYPDGLDNVIVDMNSDGQLDVLDVILLVNIILGA